MCIRDRPNPEGRYVAKLNETLGPNQTLLLKFMVVEPDDFDGTILGTMTYKDRHSNTLHTINLGTSKPALTADKM